MILRCKDVHELCGAGHGVVYIICKGIVKGVAFRDDGRSSVGPKGLIELSTI